jgi:hypothetical protein
LGTNPLLRIVRGLTLESNLVEVYARNNCPNFVATTSEFVASTTALGKAQFLMGTFFGAAWRKESVRESKYSSAFRRGAAVAIP